MANPKKVEVTPPRLKFYQADGVTPLAGGQVFVYEAGTTNKTDTWTDPTGTTLNPNPIVLDANGECTIWIPPIPGTPVNPLPHGPPGPPGPPGDIAALSVPAGSSFVGFMQAGGGAVARTVQDKLQQSLSVKDFGAIGNGVADDTSAIRNAIVSGESVYLPTGTYVTDNLVLPPTLRALYGTAGTTLKFTRRIYAPSDTVISATATTGGLLLANFAIDVDDPTFGASRIIRIRNSANISVDLISITGSGSAGMYLVGCTNVVVSRCSFTGTSGGFHIGALCLAASRDCVAVLTRHDGIFEYGVQWSQGEGHQISQCHSEGALIWPFSLADVSYGSIANCFSKNSVHEAFQLTSCSYCAITNCQGEWTNGGQDFAISVDGGPAPSRFNRIMNNILINSQEDGIAFADDCSYNVASNNTLVNCGVRAAILTPGAGSATVCYTIAPKQCIRNTFESNVIVSESGPVDQGYFEAPFGGGTVDFNIVKGNRFSGTFATRYSIAGADTEIFDDTWQPWSPAVTSSIGAITSFTINSAQYRQQGKTVDIQLDITITDNGTGDGRIDITLPFAASMNAGTIAGSEVAIGNRPIIGVASGTTVGCLAFDGTYPAATSAQLVLFGTYRAA